MFESLRALFPVMTRAVYLNHAAESPTNLRVRARLDEYLDACPRPDARGPVKGLLAQLLGGAPEEYALVTSTGHGLGLVASGFPWQPGDNVVLPAEEHWNNTFPWMALRARGVELRLVPVGPDQRVDPEDVARHVDRRTRVLSTAAVRHLTGFRSDLKGLSHIAHDVGALFVVDGVQAAGLLPLNVDEDGIDALACAGFKWLLGLPGTGFLYVRRSAWDRLGPSLPGMYAAEDDLKELRLLPDARRYETGTLAYPLFHGWTAGLELLLELGVPALQRRVLALTDLLVEGLRARGLELHSPIDRPEERSAILSFSAGSPQDNHALMTRLRDRGIVISLRGGRCRVSPSFMNTEAEIHAFFAAME